MATMVFFVTRSINQLAGQETVADIGVKFLANVRISEALAWAFGVGGVTIAWRQRNLRREETKRLGGRLRHYETTVDPRRSSSDLESQGDYGED